MAPRSAAGVPAASLRSHTGRARPSEGASPPDSLSTPHQALLSCPASGALARDTTMARLPPQLDHIRPWMQPFNGTPTHLPWWGQWTPTQRPTLWQRRSPGEQHDSSKCLGRIREECVKERRTSERFRTSVLGLNWSSKPLTAGSGGPLTLEIQPAL